MRKLEDKLSRRSPGRPKNDLASTGGVSEGVAEPGAQATPGIKARRPAIPAAARTADLPVPEPAPAPAPAPATVTQPLHPRRVWPD